MRSRARPPDLKPPDDHAFTDVVRREKTRIVRAVKELVAPK